MIPTKAVRLQLGELLAADATTLAPAADANKVALIVAPFTPVETLVLGDLTLASFTGSTPLAAGTGTQQAGIDPATGQQVVTILEPAGGFRWECTASPAEPQIVYGFALTDNAGAVLLGVEALAEPVTISAAGEEINIGRVSMRIIDQPMI